METMIQTGISDAQRELACNEFAAAQQSLIDEIGTLTETQWTFKPSADRWSIAETVQHLTEVQGRVHVVLSNLQGMTDPEALAVNEELDAAVRKMVRDRSNRISAPPHLHPSGAWTLQEALQRFDEGTNASVRLMCECTCLRGRGFPHPIMGPMDGYQWLIAAAAHTDRHVAQVREIKTDPAFPPA